MGTKGARITSHVSLPGKYLVYMPTGRQIGISKRIGDEKERRRLREAVSSAKPKEGGVIVRTASEGMTKQDVGDDVRGLDKTWRQIREKSDKRKAPALLYSDLDVVLRCMRDMLSEDVDDIVLDVEADYERTHDFVENFMPSLAARVRFYDDVEPIFDRYGVEDQVNRATEPKVWLKSGGYLVIDQGEAVDTQAAEHGATPRRMPAGLPRPRGRGSPAGSRRRPSRPAP